MVVDNIIGFRSLPSSLLSVIYSFPPKTSSFHGSVLTQSITTLAYNTQHMKFLVIQLIIEVLCLTYQESTIPIYLVIYNYYS